MRKNYTIVTILLIMVTIFNGYHCQNSNQHSQSKPQKTIKGVPFTDVTLEDRIWSQRIKTNRDVSIPLAFQKCEETGRLDNFALAGNLIEGEQKGDYPFDDTDVYKVIEGASYALIVEYDSTMDAYLDSLIILIAAAQEDDGYIYTCRTNQCERLNRWMGDDRWENLNSHELYNCGHLYEAAVAHYMATGKSNLLDVAIKNADLINQVFGPGEGQKKCPSGHPIIEMALVKLYLITDDEKYLELAKFFIDETGVGTDGHELSMYSQDHKPIREQEEAVGHAVRFGYLYSGVADVASLTNDSSLLEASKRVWENVVNKKLYITGGIGARAMGEGFGNNYELPNMTAYCETCASIANVYWNYRMFLLTGDAKYYDILERTLYNSLLSGVSFRGDRFFYDNVLESDGFHERESWFGCACCPGNVTRFMASVPGYVYATDSNKIYVNLYGKGDANLELNGGHIDVSQKSDYPWDGRVTLTLTPEVSQNFDMYLRIPGWAQNQVVPSDLYRFMHTNKDRTQISVNGKQVSLKPHNGYVVISRQWEAGDQIELIFPMPVRRIVANDSVVNNRNKVALQRGPIVYCLEGRDQLEGHVFNLFLPDTSSLKYSYVYGLLGGVMQLEAIGSGVFRQGNSIKIKDSKLVFIPYYAWNNRGKDEMIVWIPRSVDNVILTPIPSIASLSTPTASTDWAPGLNDQFEPTHSGDIDKLFFYWWLKKETEEWVQYDFDKEYTISASEVYWLNYDHYDQVYRVPESWELLYKDGEDFKPVINLNEYGTELDKYNLVQFEPVTTTALRLNAKLQPDCSGGILELKIHK